MYGLYYQAKVDPAKCWYFVAILRSFEHLAFDRTYDKQESIFEFFLPPGNEKTFLELMDYFQHEGIVSQLCALPHRLQQPGQKV